MPKKSISIRNDREIVLVSTSEELYRSFHRAFKAINNINVIWISSESNLHAINDIKDKTHNVILLHTRSREEKYTLLWEKIIINFRCNLPIIAMGYHELNISEDLRGLVFKEEETKVSYRYFPIPVSIIELSNAIFEVRPYFDKLSDLVKKYCKWEDILKAILTHKIPNRLRAGLKEEAIEFYKGVKNAVSMVGASEKIVLACDDAINKIKTQNLEENLGEFTKRAEEIYKLIKGENSNE